MTKADRPKRLISVSFPVPLTESVRLGSGELHPADRWRKLETKLIENWGGWSKDTEVSGEWKNPETGVVEMDQSRKYMIAIEETRLAEFRQFLRDFVGPLFVQQEVLLEIGGPIEFIKSDRERFGEF